MNSVFPKLLSVTLTSNKTELKINSEGNPFRWGQRNEIRSLVTHRFSQEQSNNR
jgi:hypothetical protein